MSGKRETTPSRRRRKSSGLAGWWQQHREWVAGLDRGQKLRYRLLQTLVVLSILVIGVWLGLKMWMKLPEIPDPSGGTGTTQGDGAPNFDAAELPDVAKSGRRPGVYTFLLVGQDTAGGGNTDTMLLITFDSKAKTVHGMSLPRDTMINTSRKGSGHRLNAVYNFNKGSDPDTQLVNGVTALKKEVGKLTGIVPDFYVVVQWEAVGRLVDAIGGVHFEVPFDMDYDDPTPGQDLHIHLKKGYQKLNGEQAMGLIRWRHNNDYSVQYPNGDLGRVQTQQAFLKAVAAECLKPEILLKVTSLAEIFMENVSTLADYFVICTATSTTQIKAMSDACEEAMEKQGERVHHIEGHRGGTWLLMDFSSVVVHIFMDEARKFYDLERLWGDAEEIPLEDVLKDA